MCNKKYDTFIYIETMGTEELVPTWQTRLGWNQS